MRTSIKRLQKALEDARDNYLSHHLEPGVAEVAVQRRVDKWMDEIITSSLGIRTDFGRIEINRDSPLYKAIQGPAAERARAIVARMVVGDTFSTIPTPKQLQAIKSAYRDAFLYAAIELAKSEGTQAGENFASKITFEEPVEDEKV